MTTSYIGIGSNVGDRAFFCRRAVDELRAQPGVKVEAVSSLYETSPVGGPPQRSFLNVVTRIAVDFGARELLRVCREIEDAVGREPSEIRWGPRVIDLDVLTFGDEKINEPDLEIPHPRMTQRRFVLAPLLEIDPDVADPWGRRYGDWIDEAEGEVEFFENF
ncbi:MAG: 2-amino-4-hydroxy-6-hydroxymethyldihydropteridine diphosphokinase [Actinomycetota bacterium]|nr:2-amino-4-hydroxy-6-hydroxymethyldihydropteridine diphosphokinase [Actinomycetota bacterium]